MNAPAAILVCTHNTTVLYAEIWLNHLDGEEKVMKIIFCGDRYWKDRERIIQIMTGLMRNLGTFTVIEGEALGADTISREAAEMLGLPVEPYPADWFKHGRAAGPIRNSQMLKSGADAVIAFHNDLKHSKGTKNMVEQAMKAGLEVWVSTMGEIALTEMIIVLKGKLNDRT